MALREDEDVAKAMGINHVMTKLMAFASGAFFAGLGGTLFAAKLVLGLSAELPVPGLDQRACR